jgi:hypothetical protein
MSFGLVEVAEMHAGVLGVVQRDRLLFEPTALGVVS